jgi:hypothetical protein
VLVVALRYESLPAVTPITRWESAPRTLFLALRVPLVNLCSVALIDVLGRSLRRTDGIRHTDSVVSVLLLTAAAKSVIEAISILALPNSQAWTMPSLAAILVVGLGLAAYLARDLIADGAWRRMHATKAETVALAGALLGIAILNLPLLMR